MQGVGRSIGLAGLLALMAVQPLSAAMCRGVNFPQTVEAQGAPLELHGLGIRKATFLKIAVYVAALYLPPGGLAGTGARVASGASGASGASIIASPGPMELVLNFVRGVGVRDIRKAFEEGFAAQGGGSIPLALASRVATFNSRMQDMRSGEPMTFVRIPGRGVELEIDGRSRGIIPGDDFAQALFAIWLGAHPPNPELKAGLLGAACE